MDVTDTDSTVANPRGPQPDLFANRFAGAAAGLGWLTTSGHLATPEFGIRQRLVAIVTDAPLKASPLRIPEDDEDRCAGCDAPCITTCPSKAITHETLELNCDGARFRFNRIDAQRCDWSKRYALTGESGFKYLGSDVDVPYPDAPTAEGLAEALRKHDPIKKYRPVVAEPCIINCPLACGAGGGDR
jgi:ferredoxin